MSTNSDRMNVALSTQDVQDIETALDLLESKLESFRTLTPFEKRHKIRLGVNNLAFVRTAKEAYDDMPELLPRIVDPIAYENDLALLMAIRPFQSRLNKLTYLMEDSAILLGDLSFRDSLGIFHSSQEAKKRGIEGGRLWAEKLQPRFETQGPVSTEGEDDSMDGAGSDDSGGSSVVTGSTSPDNDPADANGQTQGGGNDGPSTGGGSVTPQDAG